MPVIIDGTTGVDTIQNGIVTSAKIASGQTPSFNGIQFPATQAASADANCLDDYEEGTFTPGLAYDTPGTSSFTFSNRSGQYVKIGKVVYLTADVRVASFSKGTASGQITMTGLPFTANNSGGGYENARFTIQVYDWTYSSSPVVANVIQSTNGIALGRMVSNAVTASLDDPRGGSILWITGFYFV